MNANITKQVADTLKLLQASALSPNVYEEVQKTLIAIETLIKANPKSSDLRKYKQSLVLASSRYITRAIQEFNQYLPLSAHDVDKIDTLVNTVKQIIALRKILPIKQDTESIYQNFIPGIQRTIENLKNNAGEIWINEILNKKPTKASRQMFANMITLIHIGDNQLLETPAENFTAIVTIIKESLITLAKTSQNRALTELHQLAEYSPEMLVELTQLQKDLTENFKKEITACVAAAEVIYNENDTLLDKRIKESLDKLRELSAKDQQGLTFKDTEQLIAAYETELKKLHAVIIDSSNDINKDAHTRAIPALKYYAQISGHLKALDIYLDDASKFSLIEHKSNNLLENHRKYLQRAVNGYEKDGQYFSIKSDNINSLYVKDEINFALPIITTTDKSNHKPIKLNFQQLKYKNLDTILKDLNALALSTKEPRYAVQASELRNMVIAQIKLYAEQLTDCEAIVASAHLANLRELIKKLPDDMQELFNGELEAAEKKIVRNEQRDSKALEENVSANNITSSMNFMVTAFMQFKFKQAANAKEKIDIIFVEKINKLTSALPGQTTKDILEAIRSFNNDYEKYVKHLFVFNASYQNERVQYFSASYNDQSFSIAPVREAYQGYQFEMAKLWASNIESLINLPKTNDAKNLQTNFAILKELLTFERANQTSYNIIMPSELNQAQLSRAFGGIENYFLKKQNRFKELLSTNQITDELKSIMDDLKKADGVLNEAKTYGDLSKIKTYQEIQQELLLHMTACQAELSKPLAESNILEFKANNARDEFFKHLWSTYEALMKSVDLMKEHIPADQIVSLEITAKTSIATLKSNIQSIIDELKAMFPLSEKPLEQQVRFNKQLDLLRAAEEHFKEESVTNIIGAELGNIHRALDDELKTFEISPYTHSQELLDYGRKVTDLVIKLKKMAVNIPQFKEKIDKKIDEMLSNIEKASPAVMPVLNKFLMKFAGPENQTIARMLIHEHPTFQAIGIYMRNAATGRVSVEAVLNDLSGDAVAKDQLRSQYELFIKDYEQLVDDGLKKDDPKQALAELKALVDKIPASALDYKTKIRKILAYTFAYWTLEKSAAHYKKMIKSGEPHETAKLYLLQPHAAQIFGILRLFNVDMPDKGIVDYMFNNKNATLSEYYGIQTGLFSFLKFLFMPSTQINQDTEQLSKLHNHFAQILTGEGKSVTLAMIATVFAVMGQEVHCACYSKYLSERDYLSFESLFNAFCPADKKLVQYGTFQQLSENFVNKKAGNVRGALTDMINGVQHSPAAAPAPTPPPVLLVDEVDVFFSKDFYGSNYQLRLLFKNDTVSALTDMMWRERNNKDFNNLKAIKSTAEYQACVKQFPTWVALIDESIKNMRLALNTLAEHQYECPTEGEHAGHIGYKEQDGINYDQVFGYSTLFAYYQEKENNNPALSDEVLAQKKGLYLNCGRLSYAQMIRKGYLHVRGVTGTLNFIEEKNTILRDFFAVKAKTYVASAYGSRADRFKFDKEKDIHIVDEAAHFAAIVTELLYQIKEGKRAVLILMKDEAQLHRFYNSEEFENYKMEADILTAKEADNFYQREAIVSATATPGRITLATTDFGRGVDYICYSNELNDEGGLHVICSDLPPTTSDEQQYGGRTARQGGNGSFSMVLSTQSLQQDFNMTVDQVDSLLLDKKDAYSQMNKAREKMEAKEFQQEIDSAKQIQQDHERTEGFLSALNAGNKKDVNEFLVEQNRCPIFQKMTPIVIMLDATGSMEYLIDGTKDAIVQMFEDARAVLALNGLDPDLFSVQIMAYRNYGSYKYGFDIFEDSGPQTDPVKLKQFLSNVRAGSGDFYRGPSGSEALEIPFYYLNQQADKPDKVLVLSDAPANSVEISRKGNRIDHQAPKTNIDDEILKLNEHKIPVNTFYLHDRAQSNLNYIAKSTGGKSDKLNIADQKTAAATLTRTVTTQILESIGGETLVQSYQEYLRTQKSYLASSASASTNAIHAFPVATATTTTSTAAGAPVVPHITQTPK